MLYFKLKHKDKEIPFKVPGSLNEVPFKVFLDYSEKLEANGKVTPIEIVSLFTDVDLSIWKQASEIDLYALVKTTIDQYDWEFKGKPETIWFKNKKGKHDLPLNVPKDIAYKSIGQFEDFEAHIRGLDVKTNHSLLKSYPFLMAIYFQPEIDGGDYDYSRAQEIANDFLECSAYDVVRTVNFFLKKRLESETNIKDSMKLSTPTTK